MNRLKKYGMVLCCTILLCGCSKGTITLEDMLGDDYFKASEENSLAAEKLENTDIQTIIDLTESDAQENESATDTEIDLNFSSVKVDPDGEYLPDDEYVREIGRTYYANKVRWMSFSGSGMEFKVYASSLTIQFYGDTSSYNAISDENCARFAIYLDGKRVEDIMMTEGAKNITLFEGTEKRSAEVKIVKLSEALMSTVGVRRIIAKDGVIMPTEEKEHLIEFVGDSITCGYGVDDESRTSTFHTRTEDATKTYAYQAAELLNADCSLVSLSGYGVLSGYSTSGNLRGDSIMSKYYDISHFIKIQGDDDMIWDFSAKREPDLVVINLGTNDNSYVQNNGGRKQQFSKQYMNLIQLIRKKNPDATILCTLGIMGDDLYISIVTAVNEYSQAMGDYNIDVFHFDPIREDEGYAAEWHPTLATHTRAAKELTEKIKEIWK